MAIANISSAFELGTPAETRASEVEIDKLHAKIGQRVVEWDFLANASHQLLGTRGREW